MPICFQIIRNFAFCLLPSILILAATSSGREAKLLSLHPDYQGEDMPYFRTEEEQGKNEIKIKNGIFVDLKGNPYNSGDGRTEISILVETADHRYFVHPVDIQGAIRHSSLNAGKPIWVGTRLKIKNGLLLSIQNYSGHYRPPPQNLFNFLDRIERKGVSVTNTEIMFQPDSFVKYLREKLDSQDLAWLEKYKSFASVIRHIESSGLQHGWIEPYRERILSRMKGNKTLAMQTISKLFDNRIVNPQVAAFLAPVLRKYPGFTLNNSVVVESLSLALKDKIPATLLNEFEKKIAVLKKLPREKVSRESILQVLSFFPEDPGVEKTIEILFREFWFKDSLLESHELQAIRYQLTHSKKELADIVIPIMPQNTLVPQNFVSSEPSSPPTCIGKPPHFSMRRWLSLLFTSPVK